MIGAADLWHLAAVTAGPRSSLGFGGIDGLWGAILKAILPAVAYVVAAPAIWWLFRDTWKELNVEATHHRFERELSGKSDHRPWVMFGLVALVLTAQEYYGGSRFFGGFIRPWLRQLEQTQRLQSDTLGHVAHFIRIDSARWGELYKYAWWALTRVVGYTFVPLFAYKAFFPRDSLLDMGLRTRGMWRHTKIYLLCLAVVVPCVFIVSRSPEFTTYYPFYKLCSRSWLDFFLWESLYLAQFFALEVFFRGFMLHPLRKVFGAGAIFAMCVPYVMIHFGKPYLEASGAFLAGVALGSLSMKTRSVYWGVLVHWTVALMMDSLALMAGPGFPTRWFPG